MFVLILGLILFLGPHSVRIVGDDWRSSQIDRLGLNAWKGLYSVISIVGFVLIVWGYGRARAVPVELWQPPLGMRHLASLLTLAAFVLIAAAYVPRSRIRAFVGHPMVIGVMLWALGHLLSNGSLADLVLFGAFLVWAVLDLFSARRRDRVAGTARSAGALINDLTSIVIGVVAWFVFAMYLHAPLIGVRPFG